MPRGLSMAEKKKRAIEHLFESKSVFKLDELKTEWSSKKKISKGSIEAVVQELLYEDLLHQEKIGSSNYIWSFESEQRVANENKLKKLVSQNYLIKTDKEKEIKNYFNDSNGIKMIIHTILVLFIFCTSLASHYWISRPIELSEAVQFGVKVLGTDYVEIQGWICFAVFWVLIIIYFHREIWSDLSKCGDGAKYIFYGCKINKQIETVYNTPYWDNAPKEFKEFLNKTNNDKNKEIKQQIQLSVN
eukprot:43790_1